jgi:hypothetical protein
METPDMLDPAIGKQARYLEAASILATVLLGLAILKTTGIVVVVPAVIGAIREGDPAQAVPALDSFLRALIQMLPTLCFLSGVWAARGLFGRIARGEIFSLANSKAIADVGSALLWGAAVWMIVAPVILGIIDQGRGRWGMRVEPEALVLAVIGGAVLMIGQIMAKAQSENASLRAELTDFV